MKKIDVDAYCTGCNSDQFTKLDTDRHPTMRWCGLCWDWQKPLSNEIKALVRKAQEEN